MKIGMLVNNLSVSGGYQKLVLRLSEQLLLKGYEVVIYTLDLNKKKCYPDLIDKFNIVCPVQKKNDKGGELLSRLNNRFLRYPYPYKIMTKSFDPNIDVFIIHDDISLRIISFFKRTKNCQKIIWMLNNQLPEDISSLIKKSTKYFIAISSFKELLYRIATYPSLLLDYFFIKKGLKLIDKFAVYDIYNQRLVKKLFKQDAALVYAGADLERFKEVALSRTYDAKKQYNLLSVGVLFPHRRYEDFLTAVSILKKNGRMVTATIVGAHTFAPEYYKFLVKLAEKLQITDFIIFKEFVSDNELYELYNKSDAFIFVNDGFTWGISVFEAIAAGLPTIITNNIGAADIIKHRHYGWVVEPRRPDQIAASVEEIISNQLLTVKICKQASRDITNLVSWSSYADRIIALF